MTLRLHVSEQGGFFTEVSLLPLADGDAFTVHGSALKCFESDSHATFIGYSQATIETTLRKYLEGRGVDCAGETRLFILDMEHPTITNSASTFAHPSDLHLADATKQAEIITAWKTRIAAARAVLPRARLGMYGLLQPDSRGRADNATYLARLACLRDVAGPAGLYDGLDVFVPLFFPRFGPHDNLGEYYSLEAYIALGCAGSAQLKKSNGASVPLAPFFTYSVANGLSADDDLHLLDLDPSLERMLALPLSICEQAGLTEAVFWVGVPDGEVLGETNPNGWTVTDYIRRLNMATRFKLIREKQVAVIRALTPSLLPSLGRFVPWERQEVRGGFASWAAGCPEPFRRFDIVHGRDFEEGRYLDRDTDFIVHTEELLVAYPAQEDLYGERIDDIIDQDLADLNKAIGQRGYADYDALGTGLHKCRLVDRNEDEVGAARIVRARFRLEYDRSM